MNTKFFKTKNIATYVGISFALSAALAPQVFASEIPDKTSVPADHNTIITPKQAKPVAPKEASSQPKQVDLKKEQSAVVEKKVPVTNNKDDKKEQSQDNQALNLIPRTNLGNKDIMFDRPGEIGTPSSMAQAEKTKSENRIYDAIVKEEENDLRQTHKDTDNVEFLDHNLKNHLLQIIKHKNEFEITYKEAAETKGQLYLSQDKIENIRGLHAFKNVTELHLDDNHIADLTPLKGMTNLEHLNIGLNGARDITPLANLKKLKMLEAHQNNIEDLSALKEMKELNIVNLSNNKLTDKAVEGVFEKSKDLQILLLHNNKLTKSDFAKKLTSLAALDLSSNKIESVKALKNLKLQSLSLSNNSIKDITPLTGKSFDEFNISQNPLTNVSDLDEIQTTDSDAYNFVVSVNHPASRTIKLPFKDCTQVSFSKEDLDKYGSFNLKSGTLTLKKDLKEDVKLKFSMKNSKFLGSHQGTLEISLEDILGREADVHMQEQKIVFHDKAFEQAILSSVTHENKDYITMGEASIVTSLDLRNKSLKDIRDIAYFSNLEHVNVSGNQITNISSLAKLSKLKTLVAQRNQITDFWMIENKIPYWDCSNQIFNIQVTNPTANPINIPAGCRISYFATQVKLDDNFTMFSLLNGVKKTDIEVLYANSNSKNKKYSATYHITLASTTSEGVGNDDTEDEDSVFVWAEKLNGMIRHANTVIYSNNFDHLNYEKSDAPDRDNFFNALVDAKKTYKKLSSTKEDLEAACTKLANTYSKLNGVSRTISSLTQEVEELSHHNTFTTDPKIAQELTQVKEQLKQAQLASQSIVQKSAEEKQKFTTQISSLNKNIKDLKEQITTLQKQKAHAEEVAREAEKARLAAEQKLVNAEDTVKQLTSKVKRLTQDLANAKNTSVSSQEEIQKLQEKLDTATSQVTTMKSEVERVKKELADTKELANTEKEKANKKISELETTISSLEKTKTQLQKEKEQLISDKKALSAQVDSLKLQLQTISQTIVSTSTDADTLKLVKDLKGRVNQYSSELDAAHKQIDSMKLEHEKEKKSLNQKIATLQSNLSNFKKQIEEFKKADTEKTQKIQELTVQNKKQAVLIQELSSKADTLQTQVNEVSVKLQQANANLAIATTQLQSANSQLSQLKEQLKNVVDKKEAEKLNQRIQGLETQVSSLNNQLTSMKEEKAAISKRLDTMTQQFGQMTTQFEQLKKEKKVADENVIKFGKALKTSKDELAKVTKELTDTRTRTTVEKQALQQKVAQMEQKVKELQHQLLNARVKPLVHQDPVKPAKSSISDILGKLNENDVDVAIDKMNIKPLNSLIEKPEQEKKSISDILGGLSESDVSATIDKMNIKPLSSLAEEPQEKKTISDILTELSEKEILDNVEKMHIQPIDELTQKEEKSSVHQILGMIDGDVIINNAGKVFIKPISDLTKEEKNELSHSVVLNQSSEVQNSVQKVQDKNYVQIKQSSEVQTEKKTTDKSNKKSRKLPQTSDPLTGLFALVMTAGGALMAFGKKKVHL